MWAVIEEDLDRHERQAEGAQPFEPNPFYERLIQMRERDPRAFSSISPAAKLSLGYYEAAKRRAALLTS